MKRKFDAEYVSQLMGSIRKDRPRVYHYGIEAALLRNMNANAFLGDEAIVSAAERTLRDYEFYSENERLATA